MGHDGGGDCLEAKIEVLLNVEKQLRQIGDVVGTQKAVTDIVQLCFEAGAWQTLNEQIQLISKRRGQLKQVVQSMVQQAMQFIDQTPDLDTKIELIKTLNNVVQSMVQQVMQFIDQTPDLDTKIELIKTLNNVSAGKVDIEGSLKVKRMEPKTRQEVKVDSHAPADDTKSEVTPKTPLGKGGKLKKGEVSTLEKGSSSSPKGRKKERNSSSSSSSSSGGFRVKRRIKLPFKKQSRFVVMESEGTAHRAPQRSAVGQLIRDLGHGARPRRRF